MESRPERGVARRLMWEAASVVASEDETKKEVPPAPKPPGTSPAADKSGPSRGGPGSQIRRYVPVPRSAPAKPPEKPSEPRT